MKPNHAESGFLFADRMRSYFCRLEALIQRFIQQNPILFTLLNFKYNVIMFLANPHQSRKCSVHCAHHTAIIHFPLQSTARFFSIQFKEENFYGTIISHSLR